MHFVISAPQVIAGSDVHAPGQVVVVDGRIADVRPGRPPADAAHVALASGTLAPGLIDLQVNGFAGTDVGEDGPDALGAVARAVTRTGVTAFLPTLVTAPLEDLAAGLRRLAAAQAEQADAPVAQSLGVHVEGPFLAGAQRGAHDPEHLRDPEPRALATLLDAAPGALRVMTLAPERDGGLEAIATLTARGVVAAIGHSDATAEQVRAAADAGARKVTHLFNAQRGLHHREPGVVGAALTEPRLICGLIVDLHHVAPQACRIALAAAPGRVALVSDAAAAADMPPGTYTLGGAPIELVADGPPRRPDGTLAGSALALDRAIANAVGLGMGLVEAIAAATSLPADLLGDPERGRLRPGARADLVWLGDDLLARATWVGGRLAHGPAELAQPSPATPLPAVPTAEDHR